jgi:hypothetical protein
MKDNDKYLKDIWNKAESLIGSEDYESNTIERFISKRSTSTAAYIKKMIFLDIALKSLTVIILGIDIFFYYGTTNVISVCITGITLLIILLLFQIKLLNQFAQIADYGQTPREKLASMLTYLQNRFYTTLLAISSTYLFVFISGSLLYFYAAYGQVRPLDGQDIIVFSILIIFGIGFNFIVNYKQVAYQIKHIEACLSDLNDNTLPLVLNNIEIQRKQDRTNKLLLMLVLIIGFVLLIAVFKNIGFLIR